MIQVAQRAEDLDRATRFYTELLGTGPVATYDPPGLVFFDLDGLRLLLDRGHRVRCTTSGWTTSTRPWRGSGSTACRSRATPT